MSSVNFKKTMENINSEGKKVLLKKPAMEKVFLTVILLCSFYAFYPLFVMQIKFFFDSDYPNDRVYYTTVFGQYDFIFMQSAQIIDGPGKVCFLNPGSPGASFGTFSGKANYFLYPNKVKSLSRTKELVVEDFRTCQFLMVLDIGETEDKDVRVLDEIPYFKSKYRHISKDYSLLIYRKR